MSRKILPIFQAFKIPGMLTVYGMLSAIWQTLHTMHENNSMDGTPVSVPALVACRDRLRQILADYKCRDYSDNVDNLHNLSDVRSGAESLLLDSAFRPLPMRNGRKGKRETACDEIIAICIALRDFIRHQLRTHHYSRPVEILEASETDLYVADPSTAGSGEIYIRHYKGCQLGELRAWSVDFHKRHSGEPGYYLPIDLPVFLYQWAGGPWRDNNDEIIPFACFPQTLTPRYV